MALLGGEQRKAGRRGDLHDRPARPEQGIRRAHGAPEGVERVDLPDLAPAGGGKHLGRALPAVGHGDGVHLGPGDDARRLLGNEMGDLDGRERALERVGRHDDAHDLPLLTRAARPTPHSMAGRPVARQGPRGA